MSPITIDEALRSGQRTVRLVEPATSVLMVKQRVGPTTVASRLGLTSGEFWVDACGGLGFEFALDPKDILRMRDEDLRLHGLLGGLATLGPTIRFESASVDASSARVLADGLVLFGGQRSPAELEIGAQLRDGALDLAATTALDQRSLGFDWLGMGYPEAPTRLDVQARLVRSARPAVHASTQSHEPHPFVGRYRFMARRTRPSAA